MYEIGEGETTNRECVPVAGKCGSLKKQTPLEGGVVMDYQSGFYVFLLIRGMLPNLPNSPPRFFRFGSGLRIGSPSCCLLMYIC